MSPEIREALAVLRGALLAGELTMRRIADATHQAAEKITKEIEAGGDDAAKR